MKIEDNFHHSLKLTDVMLNAVVNEKTGANIYLYIYIYISWCKYNFKAPKLPLNDFHKILLAKASFVPPSKSPQHINLDFTVIV